MHLNYRRADQRCLLPSTFGNAGHARINPIHTVYWVVPQELANSCNIMTNTKKCIASNTGDQCISYIKSIWNSLLPCSLANGFLKRDFHEFVLSGM